MPKKIVAGAESTEEPQQEVKQKDKTLEFPSQHKEALRGLLYLGSLRDTFTYAGHEFEIETLREGQLLKAAQLTAKYKDTIGESTAYFSALVSASVASVDGIPLYEPVGKNEDIPQKRFEKVLDWYPIVVDNVYLKVVALDKTAAAIGDELGKA